MKCANCTKDALYVYQTPSVGPIAYCVDDLPGFLRPQAKAGLLEKAPMHVEYVASAIETLSADKPKRAKKAVAPATVDDEPVVEPEEG